MAGVTGSRGRSVRAGPRREPPDLAGFRLLVREQIPLRRVGWIGMASVPAWIVAFDLLSGAFGGRVITRPSITLLGFIIGVVLALIGVPVLHEAVHGVVARLAGARPEFGVGAGFAYTTFGEPVGRLAYLVIGLAPLVVLSAAGVAVAVGWPRYAGFVLVFLVANAAGAVGDLWVAWEIRRLPPEVRIYDLADGFAAYLPESSPARSGPAST